MRIKKNIEKNIEGEYTNYSMWQIIQSIKKRETQISDWEALLEIEDYKELVKCFMINQEELKKNLWQ